MSNSPYLKQEIRKLNVLILDGKFDQAYQEIKKLLLKFPDNLDLIKLQQKIEFTAKEKNDLLIENRLRELKPLWKEEKYPEILRELKEIKKYSPNNPQILKQYKKAQELYKKDIEKSQEKFEKEQTKNLENLLQNNPDKLVEELFYLERNNIGNSEIQRVAQKYKDKLIDKKIKSHKELLNSNKFEVIKSFIEQLKRIDENNPSIPKLENRLFQNKHNNQLEKKRDFIFNGVKHLKTLIKLKKYSKAIKTAEELLEVAPENKMIQKMTSKSEKLLYFQTRESTIAAIEKSKKALQEKFQESPQNYVKI